MIMGKSQLLCTISLSFVIACQPTLLAGQAKPAATGPGGFIAVGAGVSGYHAPYGETKNVGFSLFVDANPTRGFGLEAEARFLKLHTDEGEKSSTYLLGPRVSAPWNRYRPYGKLLFGNGRFTYPFDYATGSYFVYAPGAGLDISILHGRAVVRAVDFEYQQWHDFTFGSAHPYGVTSGILFRVF